MKRWLSDVFRPIFRLLRPFLVRDVGPNEDFVCINCGRGVLRRYLYCSEECADRDGQ